jgi:type II secretory pathway pseudopilin PulG
MPTPARQAPPAEEGFILIEVLVSALILAIVAGAVLTLIAATTRSAASERNHSVAYDLAQQDQARMRTLRISTLNRYVHNGSVTVENTKYNVKSEGVFVNNRAGAVSCTAENDTADYVQLTSTVTGPGIIEPITIRSVVSPSNGSGDPSNGTLSIQATNAANGPVQGVAVKINEGAYQGSTDENGCANFAELPRASNYKVKLEGGTLINPKGESTTTVENVSIEAGQTFRLPTSFDRGGTVKPHFYYLQPGTGIEHPTAPVDTMEIFNSESGQPASTVGTFGGTRSSTLTSPLLYPFKSKFTVYPGACTSSSPDPEGKVPANDVGMAFVEIPPGGAVEPRIRVPALELTVTNSSGAVVTGAKVVVVDTKCKPGTTGGKRTYYTNSGGHLAKEPKATAETEAALPYGTYSICASAKFGSEFQRAEQSELKVQNLTATGTVLSIKLAKASSECT